VTVCRQRAAVLAAGLAFLAAACGGAAPAVDGATSPTPTTAATEPAATTGDTVPPGEQASVGAVGPTVAGAAATTPRPVTCGPVERPPLQTGSHLLGDREPPVPYSSRPPTSGWHASGHLAVDVRGGARPLSEPEQVSVLEGGGVVVSHRGLRADDVARLRDHVRSQYAGRVAVTPYDGIPAATVAFTAWGRVQRCDGVDLVALDRFVERFGPSGPVTPGH
jgi:hypothetical protein